MKSRLRQRALRIALVVCALGSGGVTCEREPIVNLGRVPTVAGMSAPAAGSGGTPIHDETLECHEVDPICGTDNVTYDNFCLLLRAGVGFAKFGPC